MLGKECGLALGKRKATRDAALHFFQHRCPLSFAEQSETGILRDGDEALPLGAWDTWAWSPDLETCRLLSGLPVASRDWCWLSLLPLGSSSPPPPYPCKWGDWMRKPLKLYGVLRYNKKTRVLPLCTSLCLSQYAGATHPVCVEPELWDRPVKRVHNVCKILQAPHLGVRNHKIVCWTLSLCQVLH